MSQTISVKEASAALFDLFLLLAPSALRLTAVSTYPLRLTPYGFDFKYIYAVRHALCVVRTET